MWACMLLTVPSVVPYLSVNTPNWLGFHITLCYWIMLSKKSDQFCWCLLRWTQREGGREREAWGKEGREHQVTLKDGPLDGRLMGALVTCDWLVEQAGLRLLARQCCPFVTNPPSLCSHWGILSSPSDTEGLDQQLTLHTHTFNTHSDNHTDPSADNTMLTCPPVHHMEHTFMQCCGNLCVNCSCRIKLVRACSVPVVCGMCESLIVLVHMYFTFSPSLFVHNINCCAGFAFFF